MNYRNFINHLNSGKPIFDNSEYNEIMHYLNNEARKITMKMNNEFHTQEELRVLFSQLTDSHISSSFSIFPPFYTDFGKNISIGENVFINAGCHFQDQGGIIIGDNCLIGHNVVFATLNHGVQPSDRNTLYPAPIKLGKNVWIGSNSVILSGVSIGDNSIIGAGAVVTKDIESNTIVSGVPTKIVKKIK